MILCGILILFFSWLLLHALMYSKSNSGIKIIEGLETSPPNTPAPTPTPTSGPTPGPTQNKSPSQAQIDENTAEIAILKTQIANLMQTAQQLKVTMLQNEVGIQNNTSAIQKVVQAQNDVQSKLSNMKSSK